MHAKDKGVPIMRFDAFLFQKLIVRIRVSLGLKMEVFWRIEGENRRK